MIPSSEVTRGFLVHNEETTEQKRAEAKMVVLRSLEDAGLPEQPPEEVLDRLALLELQTRFNQHARAIAQGVRNVLTYLKEHVAEFAISDEAIRAACIAAVIHDIGKTGPPDATLKEQRVIVDLFSYSLEGIGAPEEVTIGAVLTGNGASSKVKEIEQVLERIGLTLQKTMRNFYDKHVWWTEEILRKYEKVFGDHIRLLAASHHLDRGIDPCDILQMNEGVTGKDALGAGGRALLALDKYEAAVTRRGRTQIEAMSVVKEILHSRFGRDPLMKKIVNALEALGITEEIFIRKN